MTAEDTTVVLEPTGEFFRFFQHLAPGESPLPDTILDSIRGIGRAAAPQGGPPAAATNRSEEHTSELQSLMRISYAVFCLKKQKTQNTIPTSSRPRAHKIDTSQVHTQ